MSLVMKTAFVSGSRSLMSIAIARIRLSISCPSAIDGGSSRVVKSTRIIPPPGSGTPSDIDPSARKASR